jgi:hypothetical protein
METNELMIPEFILADIPVKDGSSQDGRIFVYCTKAMSLVEAIAEFDSDVRFSPDIVQNRYLFANIDGVEVWFSVGIVQNNCDLAKMDPYQVLDASWDYFCNYLKWQDSNIDAADFGSLN